MEANLEAVEPVAVLELLGDAIDSTNAEDVLGQLTGFADAHPTLVLDLGRVAFVDSSGCAALVGAQQRFRDAGGELLVCNLTTEVRTVLELARLTRVLSLFDTREQALAAAHGG